MKLPKAPVKFIILLNMLNSASLENSPWRLLLLAIKISSSFLVLFDSLSKELFTGGSFFDDDFVNIFTVLLGKCIS